MLSWVKRPLDVTLSSDKKIYKRGLLYWQPRINNEISVTCRCFMIMNENNDIFMNFFPSWNTVDISHWQAITLCVKQCTVTITFWVKIYQILIKWHFQHVGEQILRIAINYMSIVIPSVRDVEQFVLIACWWSVCKTIEIFNWKHHFDCDRVGYLV